MEYEKNEDIPVSLLRELEEEIDTDSFDELIKDASSKDELIEEKDEEDINKLANKLNIWNKKEKEKPEVVETIKDDTVVVEYDERIVKLSIKEDEEPITDSVISTQNKIDEILSKRQITFKSKKEKTTDSLKILEKLIFDLNIISDNDSIIDTEDKLKLNIASDFRIIPPENEEDLFELITLISKKELSEEDYNYLTRDEDSIKRDLDQLNRVKDHKSNRFELLKIEYIRRLRLAEGKDVGDLDYYASMNKYDETKYEDVTEYDKEESIEKQYYRNSLVDILEESEIEDTDNNISESNIEEINKYLLIESNIDTTEDLLLEDTKIEDIEDAISESEISDPENVISESDIIEPENVISVSEIEDPKDVIEISSIEDTSNDLYLSNIDVGKKDNEEIINKLDIENIENKSVESVTKGITNDTTGGTTEENLIESNVVESDLDIIIQNSNKDRNRNNKNSRFNRKHNTKKNNKVEEKILKDEIIKEENFDDLYEEDDSDTETYSLNELKQEKHVFDETYI